MSQLFARLEQDVQILKKRMKPSQILRTTSVEQCRGAYSKESKGKMLYCALGALMHEYYGWNGKDQNLVRRVVANDDYGVPVANLIEMNDDSKMSFSEIADKLEKAGL